VGTGLANYTITYATGNLTVNPAALTVTATGPGKTYGTALTTGSSTANFMATGMQNGETIASVTLTPNAAGLSVTTAAGAAYVVTPSAATGTINANNYTITYNVYNGTVAKALLNVNANNLVMGNGQAVPTLTYTISGFVNNDPPTVVSGTPVLTTTGTSSSPNGPYLITINQGTLSAANYSFTLINGTLTIISTVAITATQPTAAEVGPVAATYTVTLAGGSLGTALTVNYTPSGVGVNGTDYQTLSRTVTIPAGSTSATISVTPLAGANPGVGSKTVILTLQTGANYVVSATGASATGTIYDDYASSSGDGLADAMAAGFNCSPQTATTSWETEDAADDGLPASYAALVGAADIAAPNLPANYNTCPTNP